MKHLLLSHFLYIIIFIVGTHTSLHAAEQKTTLKRALGNKSISLIAVGKGGAMGDKLILNLKNNTDKVLSVVVDPALIFVPDDTTYQNLVALGSETIELQPAAVKEITITTFCGKSYAKCPKQYLRYKYWRQGDSNFVKVMKYVRENGIEKTDMNLIQRAVWTFTNNHCIGSVYSQEHPQLSEQLVKYMTSTIKKLRIPEYYAYFDINDRIDRPLFTMNNQKVSVTLKWPNTGYRSMTVKVFNEHGDVYKKVESGQYIDKDGHTVIVEFSPIKDPLGTYIVEVCDDTNKIWDKKVVKVGESPCN